MKSPVNVEQCVRSRLSPGGLWHVRAFWAFDCSYALVDFVEFKLRLYQHDGIRCLPHDILHRIYRGPSLGAVTASYHFANAVWRDSIVFTRGAR